MSKTYMTVSVDSDELYFTYNIAFSKHDNIRAIPTPRFEIEDSAVACIDRLDVVIGRVAIENLTKKQAKELVKALKGAIDVMD